jgi:uncharacterized protein
MCGEFCRQPQIIRLLFRRQEVSSDFRDLFGDWRPGEGYEGASARPEEELSKERRVLNEKEVQVVKVFEGFYESPDGMTTKSTTFVLLRDNRGREFRIFVLRDVAYAISLAMEDEKPDRPFTHDLIKLMLEKLGAKVERVIIDDLWQDTFYAKILIAQGNDIHEIDARPSDAVALALRYRAPIYVAEDVLERAQSE